jgi:hypothetical protein
MSQKAIIELSFEDFDGFIREPARLGFAIIKQIAETEPPPNDSVNLVAVFDEDKDKKTAVLWDNFKRAVRGPGSSGGRES